MTDSAPLAVQAAVAMATLCLLGCGSSKGGQAQRDGIVRVKTVAAVQTTLVRTTQQPATVHPYFETEIRARVDGYVVEVLADIGEVVEAGGLLARVDVPELAKKRSTLGARIDLLVAEERGASAGIELADAAVRSAHAKLQQARSEQAGVEASLAAAEAEFSRTEDLVNRGSLQMRVLDEVRKRRDSEAAGKDAVLSAVSAAEAEVGVADAERSAAEARLAMAKAKTQVARFELEELEVTLGFANVTAPFAGIVTQRHVDLGDLIEGRVSDGAKPLFVLSKIDKIRVQIPVPEVDAPRVQPGDSIALTFPSFAAEPPIITHVTRRTGSLDPSTRTMTVEAEIDNASGKLLPGMFGQASIKLETTVATTTLPSRAVRFDDDGNAFVYVVADDNRVRLAEVTVGIDTGTEIEVLLGIQPGDTVIGPHLKRFSDGQQVQPL